MQVEEQVSAARAGGRGSFGCGVCRMPSVGWSDMADRLEPAPPMMAPAASPCCPPVLLQYREAEPNARSCVRRVY